MYAYVRHISLAWLLLLTSLIHAQTPSKSKVTSSMSSYEELALLIKKDPNLALSRLSTQIEQAQQSNDLQALYEANILLGDLNMQEQLYSLAVDRFTIAFGLENKVQAIDKLTVAEKLGKAYLQTVDQRSAKVFQLCLEEASEPLQIMRCEEGLADAYILSGDTDKAKELLINLEPKIAENDPGSLARIQAKLASVGLRYNDLSYAQTNVGKMLENYRRSDASDYDVIQESRKQVIEETEDLDEKIEIMENAVESNEGIPEIAVPERIELADVYLEKGEVDKAILTIEKAKKDVGDITDERTKAALLKKSSDSYAAKGEYEKALKEYAAYEDIQKDIITKREEELDRKLRLIDSQKDLEVSELTYESREKVSIAERSAMQFQRALSWLLGALLVLSLGFAYFIWRSLSQSRLINKKLELQSLRAQMNPHFIFNALNSVNEYIASQDERKANRYLSTFSTLMRKVLDVNKKETIPIQEEIQIAEMYLALEHDRFKDKFDYKIDIGPSISQADIQVPPLLLQPYIENAIWHGLRYKDKKGTLHVGIHKKEKGLEIRIQDDGIGRQRSLATKTKHQKNHKSTGLKNTQNRMAIVESLYGGTYDISITDAHPSKEDPGTLVSILISK